MGIRVDYLKVKRDPSLDGSVARRASTIVLPWLLYSAQHTILFSSPYTFHFVSPLLQATWAGSRAGSPVSVSLLPLKWYGRHFSYRME
jgi:hypothetical protein